MDLKRTFKIKKGDVIKIKKKFYCDHGEFKGHIPVGDKLVVEQVIYLNRDPYTIANTASMNELAFLFVWHGNNITLLDTDLVMYTELDHLSNLKKDRSRRKMKKFFLTTKCEVSKHKPNGKKLAGFGVLHESQFILAKTNKGTEHKIQYFDLKVGGHGLKEIISLPAGEEITKIDIISFDTKI